MVLNEADDIRLGSGQVDAVYLGEDLVWPVGALTYEITAALLYYSFGNILDAGVQGSYYSGNYAYVMGTVRVKRGDTVIETLQDQVLKPSVSNTSDFVVPNDGYTYHGEDIYAYNLGGNATSAVKTSFVTVTYKNSEPFSLTTQVRQEINEEHITESTDWREGSPEITAMEVSGTRYVDLVISDYTASSGRTCPAYGGSTGMSAYGAHQMANYSSTPSYEWVTYYYTYTSGYTYTSSSATGNTRWTDPVRVGNPWDVNDTITIDLPSWLHYNSTNHTLTFDTEGTTKYENGRSYLVVAHNGSVTDSERVYQQYNVIEQTTTAYDIYVHIVRSSAFPADGGTFPVNYHARKTTTNVYTSGEPTSIASGVESYIAASPDNYVTVTDAQGNILNTVTGPLSGNGTAYLNIAANTVGQRTITVYVTPIEAMGQSQSDWRYQDVASFPQGEIYPNIVGASITLPIGAVRLHWKNTPNTTPAPTYPLTITLTNLKLHFIYDGSSTEYEARPAGLDPAFVATFQRDDSNFYPDTSRQFIELMEGSSGECWFTADSTSGVIATFPHKTFTVPGGGGPTSGL